MPTVDLGGHLCRFQEILNQRIQNDLMLSRGPLVDGSTLLIFNPKGSALRREHRKGASTTFNTRTMCSLSKVTRLLRVKINCSCRMRQRVAVRKMLISERADIYHLSSEGQCSWYEFTRSIFECAGIAAQLTAVKTADFPSPVKRPSCSVLSKTVGHLWARSSQCPARVRRTSVLDHGITTRICFE